ncbi:hypothetical protein C8R45DRAFT_1101100 [Mycena sanguinolenta]|nr:hypothetical protein C8R45DRAFT_1101100 [Mycena sanguinolenta]
MASREEPYFLDKCRESQAARLSRKPFLPACTLTSRQPTLPSIWEKKGVDFTLAIPCLKLKENSRELAERVQSFLRARSYQLIEGYLIPDERTPFIERTVVDGVFRGTIPAWGVSDEQHGQGKKVVIEFSSPNLVKPFHAGHLRSTINGAFLSNLYAFTGWDVIRVNYLGDWDIQFGLLLIGFRRYGSETKLAADAIRHLYTKIDTDKEAETASGTSSIMDGARGILRAMKNGDPATLSRWLRFRDLCVDAYKKVYARFNIEFDDYIGKALVTKDSIEKAFRELLNKTANPSFESLVNGISTYLARDVAGAIQRLEEYQVEKMIYVVGEEHDLHFAQVVKILELMEAPFAKKLEHINFGKIKRTGTSKGGDFTSLEDNLDMAQESPLSQVQTRFHSVEYATNDEIGMACVKIQDMQTKRINSYAFDALRMTSFEGDTGVYLQYVRTRLWSIVLVKIRSSNFVLLCGL